jgi:hypothetical protein
MDHGDSIPRRVAFLVGVAAAFVIANALFYWRRTPPCCDFEYTTGIPFAFMEQGEWTGTRMMWAGIAGDAAAIIAVAFFADRIAMLASTRRLLAAAGNRLRVGGRWIPLRQAAIALAIITVAWLIRLLTKQ